jgi:predicted MFS family arabinose efflux permease
VTATRSTRLVPVSLDAINFLLADVRGALGPYLNVFLVTQQHWSQSETGLVTMIGGLLGLTVQTPIGAAIDAARAERGVIVFGLAVLGAGAAVIFAWPSFWPVAVANGLMAIVGDIFAPAVAALTLGLYAILPIRAVLYTLSDNSLRLIGVQLLDGVGAGIFSALTPLVIADIMRGTGRYNLAQGAVATVQGIGASMSGMAAGVIVDPFGYNPAFLGAGGAAAVALGVFALWMPETAEPKKAPAQR